MAGDDTQGSGPDLELPSLFRRRDKRAGKKSGRTPAAAGADDGTTARADAPGPGDAPVPDTEELSVTARPVGPGADAPTQPLRPVPGATRRPPTAPPPSAPTPREPEPTPTDDTVVEEPAAEPVPTPDADPTDGPTAASPVEQPAAPVAEEPVADEPVTEEPVAEQPPARPPKPTGPPPTPRRRGPDMTWAGPAAGAGAAAPAAAPEDRSATAAEPRPGRVAVAEGGTETGPATADETTADEPADDEPATGRRLPRLRRPSVDLSVPDLSPRVAAAVAGVAVALTGIVLVWLSLQACSTVRGVSSCGGVGLLAIVLTVVAQAAVGTILLGLLGVAQARSTAVLGVGVASFVAMLLLYASLPGPWLSVALLLVTPAAHVLAEGVTSGRFSDDP